MTLEDEPLPPSRMVGVQYATGEKQRNSSRKNVDVSGGKSNVWCHKEQCHIGTWDVRFMNQGTLDMVKQEIARMNIDILGISELKRVIHRLMFEDTKSASLFPGYY